MVNRSKIVKIGIPVSLSGQFQIQGNQALAGLQAWAEDVNQTGGMRFSEADSPRPVAVIHYDDASRPEQVRLLAQRLILEDRVDLMMGPYSSVLA